MRKLRTVGEFTGLLDEKEALVCDLSASWCGPCRMVEPLLKRLEKEHPDITFVKADIDEHGWLLEAYKVQYVPTILFLRKGKVVKRVTGVESYEVLDKEAKRLLKPAKDK